jgi:hypothetical protein
MVSSMSAAGTRETDPADAVFASPCRRLAAPSHHSNAPITPESQSFLSKIVSH